MNLVSMGPIGRKVKEESGQRRVSAIGLVTLLLLAGEHAVEDRDDEERQE